MPPIDGLDEDSLPQADDEPTPGLEGDKGSLLTRDKDDTGTALVTTELVALPVEVLKGAHETTPSCLDETRGWVGLEGLLARLRCNPIASAIGLAGLGLSRSRRLCCPGLAPIQPRQQTLTWSPCFCPIRVPSSSLVSIGGHTLKASTTCLSPGRIRGKSFRAPARMVERAMNSGQKSSTWNLLPSSSWPKLLTA